MSYYTYIVRCSDGTLYTGYTKNLRKRIQQHNGLVPGGARYTTQRKPVFFVYLEKYDSQGEAMRREYKIKHLTKETKEKLVRSGCGEEVLKTFFVER